MDFSIPKPLEETLNTFRAFVTEHIERLEPPFMAQPFAQVLPDLEAARDTARMLGLFGPQIPKEFGGMGLSFVEFAFISERLGWSPIGHFVCNCQAPDAGNMEVLHAHGTPEQKERWLRPLAAGKIRSCFAMTEPDRAGSNPVVMDTTAVRDGDNFVINGRKWFTTAADGAAFAVVMAVTDPDAPPHARASQIIVPTDTPGFRIIRNIPVFGHAGDGWNSHSEVAFDGCRVPVSNVLGELHQGFAIAQARLGPGRIHHCMRWIGICERALDLMCRRAATREISPGVMLGNRQAIQHFIAEARANIHAARLLVLNAAWKIDTLGAKAAREEVSLIKFFVADTLMKTLDRAIQTHGAMGVSDDTVLSWFYRAERGARIYDGADEVHKTVLARQVLKRYGLHVETHR